MALLNTSLHISFVASIAVMIGGVAENYIQRNSPPLIEGVGYVQNPVNAGSEHVVHWAITKRTSCPGVIWRRWEGEDGFVQKEARAPATIKESPYTQFPNINVKVPAAAPVGKLDLFIDVEYNCATGDRFLFTLGPVEMIVE